MRTYIRVQANGRVTIPVQIRRKFNLQKGDLMVLNEIDGSILIKPSNVALKATLDKIGKSFRKDGMTLKKWIERGRIIREQLIYEEYALKEE